MYISEEFCQLYEDEMFSIEIRNRGKIKFFELDVDHNGYLGKFSKHIFLLYF
jgi:hypothetical protein